MDPGRTSKKEYKVCHGWNLDETETKNKWGGLSIASLLEDQKVSGRHRIQEGLKMILAWC
jgi:hypothetical protein